MNQLQKIDPRAYEVYDAQPAQSIQRVERGGLPSAAEIIRNIDPGEEVEVTFRVTRRIADQVQRQWPDKESFVAALVMAVGVIVAFLWIVEGIKAVFG